MRDESKVPFANFTGRGVRVAIIDSGVNPAHPHVNGVAGGVGVDADGLGPDFLDYVGHGTAVAGAIRERAPEAQLYAVKVFDQSLRTNAETILRAIDWAIENEMHVVNLSLGTVNERRRPQFEGAAARAAERGVILVAAREMNDQSSLPGCLPLVIGVVLDWDCPRETYRFATGNMMTTFRASGYPRSIPGVPPGRNLSGVSFAVANMTGFVALARQSVSGGSFQEVERRLIEGAW